MEFELGDRVELINYSHLIWISKHDEESFNKNFAKVLKIVSESEDMWICDLSPERIGWCGVIETKSETQGKNQYGIRFDNGGYVAWFTEHQLQKTVFQNPCLKCGNTLREQSKHPCKNVPCYKSLIKRENK